ncbi:MAG: tyrosine-type recombinase/integrase [Candidatus Bathyarchaeia archaeon]
METKTKLLLAGKGMARASGPAAFKGSLPGIPQTPNPSPLCPSCGSQKVWKDGWRHTDYCSIQRWLCRSCGHRFSWGSNGLNMSQRTQRIQTNHLKSGLALLLNRQICAAQPKGAKNLATVESPIQGKAQGESTEAIQGKLIEFAWWMKKQGYAEETIRGSISALRTLAIRGANLFDPESVKDIIARQKWSDNRKRNAINAYALFVKFYGLIWEKPKCPITDQKIPFIPTEQEIDALIAGCGKKVSTFLQLLKETAMRAGEAKRLQWTDIDFEKGIIILNRPEKGSKPRIWKVSPSLIERFKALPKESQRVFGDGPINSIKGTFLKARKKLAANLQNPRLNQISFHTFRHWKATMLYHQTKDLMLVKEFLGHKSVKNTEIYITLEKALFQSSNDEFTVKVAATPDEIKGLLEVGFEYVCQKDGLAFFRKRK